MADVEYGKHGKRDVVSANALFDGGADGGGFDEEIIEMVERLEARTIAVGTAIGVDVKQYNRAKLKLVGNRFQEEQIFNIKKGGLEEFESEIKKKIEIGCLVEVPPEELKELLKKTHHFYYLATVVSENSESTPTR